MCLFAPDIFSAPTTEGSQKGPEHLLNGQRKALNFWNWPKSDRVRLGSGGLEGLSVAQIVTKHVCLSFRRSVAARRCQSGRAPFEAVRRDVNLKFQRPCKISTIWGTQAQPGQTSNQPERCLCVFEAKLRWTPKIKPLRVSRQTPKSSLLYPKSQSSCRCRLVSNETEEHFQAVRLIIQHTVQAKGWSSDRPEHIMCNKRLHDLSDTSRKLVVRACSNMWPSFSPSDPVQAKSSVSAQQGREANKACCSPSASKQNERSTTWLYGSYLHGAVNNQQLVDLNGQ